MPILDPLICHKTMRTLLSRVKFIIIYIVKPYYKVIYLNGN